MRPRLFSPFCIMLGAIAVLSAVVLAIAWVAPIPFSFPEDP